MELGNSVDQSGKAAFKPEHTRAHDVAKAFSGAVGYDNEGKIVSPVVPSSGYGNSKGTSPFGDGAKNS